jgi:hypothetical protein
LAVLILGGHRQELRRSTEYKVQAEVIEGLGFGLFEEEISQLPIPSDSHKDGAQQRIGPLRRRGEDQSTADAPQRIRAFVEPALPAISSFLANSGSPSRFDEISNRGQLNR